MTGHYFDMDGNPIPLLEWGRRREDYESRILCRDMIGDLRLVTIWLGFVDPTIDGARLFGTALFDDGPGPTELETYDTEADAIEGHARHHAALTEQS